MKQIKLFFVLFCLILLSACAAKKQLGAYYQPGGFSQNKEQYSRVYVYFPNHGLAKGANGPMIYFNNRKVASLVNAGYTVVYVRPGAYNIHTVNITPVLSRLFENKEINVKFEAGKTYYIAYQTVINKSIDVFYTGNGEVAPTVPTNFNSSELINLTEMKALPGLSLCHYVAPEIIG